jgi:hypothetical protein
MKIALYFGCLREPGHYLFHPERRLGVLDPKRLAADFPWRVELIDAGLLKNGEVPDSPDGRVFSTLAKASDGGAWHAFYWWDRSIDGRPGSNSGFYIRGFALNQRDEAFEFAKASWPDVIDRQKHPLQLTPPLWKPDADASR